MTAPRNVDDTAPDLASMHDLRQVPPANPITGKLYDTGAHRTAADRNCLSWWLPRLLECGVPTPRTVIVPTEPDLRGDELLRLLDGNRPAGYAEFIARLTAAVVEVQAYPPAVDDRSPLAKSVQPVAPAGTPAVFLRTGHTSGKHRWRDTCRLIAAGDLERHVYSLVEVSGGGFPFGVPMGVWAVRELLHTRPVAFMERYGGLPLVREIRAFVRGGEVECLHPYWPGSAVAKGVRDGFDPDDLDDAVSFVSSLPVEDVPEVLAILKAVADGFAGLGWWSVDLLSTAYGWFVTDMAEGRRSWHYDGCPHHPDAPKGAGLGWWRVERHKAVWVVRCLGPSFGGYLTPETVADKARRGIVNIPAAAHHFTNRADAESAAAAMREQDRNEGGKYAEQPGGGE